MSNNASILLEFTHANNRQKVYVAKSLIFSIYYAEVNKCTFILSSGGAILPVSESVEEVRAKVASANT